MPTEEEKGEFLIDHPVFADAQRRLTLQVGNHFFYVDTRGEIKDGKVKKTGIRPECHFFYEREIAGSIYTRSGYTGYLEPGVIWGLTEDEVRMQLEQRQSQSQPMVAPAESQTALVAPGQAVEMITLEQRFDMQRRAGAPIFLNAKGGVDTSNIAATAMDLTVRIAHPISAFDVQSMEELVNQGFVNPVLYRVLKVEFNQLFDQIKALLVALEVMKSFPEDVINTMRQALYKTANALVVQFLSKHAELIEFMQLATVSQGDFAARALCAIMGGQKRQDFLPSALHLIEAFRTR